HGAARRCRYLGVSSLALPARRRFVLGRRSRILIGVLACAGSAAAFVLLRLHTAYPSPTFQGACERLRASGIGLTERDWFCRPLPWTVRAGYVTGSLLVAAGFALGPAILAARGRRWSAFVPLVPVLGARFPGLLYAYPEHWWNGATWPTSETLSAVVTLALLAVPAAAVMLLRRHDYAIPRPVSAGAAILAGAIVAAAAFAITRTFDPLFDRHFALIGGTMNEGSALMWSAAAIALFGALLGPDRRWWPWSLVPIAILSSTAISAALLVGPERFHDWSRFGAVVPFVAMGAIASAWRPLAERITRSVALPTIDPPDVVVPARIEPSARPARLRPLVVVNASTAALVVVSLVAFVCDPLPAQLSSALPTYVGERVAAADVRTRMNLRMGLAAMDDYRAENGTYRGFDVQTATDLQPALRWVDRSDHTPGTFGVQVMTASAETARLVSISNSGNAYCIERSGRGVTYGKAAGDGTRPDRALIADAIAGCGSMPWTSSALTPPPWRTMCDGLDDSSYLICRTVQVIEKQTLQNPVP
ncbi:MAG: hypothetical protein ACXVPL_06880, partial [Actinomycetota bacterium]